MASKPLVIVESPAKAKTIGQFLGANFKVMASVGHVVDLPSSGLCVDVDNDFALTYEVTKKDVVRDLKEALKGASELYLATDEDREGEAIAWHLNNQLKPKVPVKRMVFHEITKKAINEAVDHSRDIDEGLVDAQEARRTLDRLYGYEVSPVLWRKVKTGLSAGRVQSPAIRLIVERERERMRFTSVTYWDVDAKHPTSPAFESSLFSVAGQRVASGKDFDENGKLSSDNFAWIDESKAKALAEQLAGQTFTVKSLEKRPYRSSPKAPFMTSTMQQEGGRKLNMSAQQVMRVAQGLYERGYITYMRTDSTSLSETAIKAARAQVTELFGANFLPASPRVYVKKVKNAQEAHEAIRPAGESFRTPDELRGELAPAESRLYELIWKRTLASQMVDCEGETMSVRLSARAGKQAVEFSASGRTIRFPGYMQAYVEDLDDPKGQRDDQENPLPLLKEGDKVPVSHVEAKGHTTAPPSRYTEASLVKKLEELSIGRPSTYASIMGTLQAKYVWKKGQAMIPNWEAFAVVALMEKHFIDLVDLQFTAELEEELDLIAGGERAKVAFLREFYFGDKKHAGLKKQVTQNLELIDAAAINSIHIGKDANAVDIVVKPGRYGPYIKRGEDTVSVPENIPPDEVTVEKALALLAAPKGDTPIGTHPDLGKPVFVKQGRFGPYVQMGIMGDEEKPKTASLFKSMKPESTTLEQALQLLSLPRVVGTAEDGESVTAQNGRYGPYITKGKDSRNMGVENEDKLLTLTLDEAMLILKTPKQFRGRGTPKPPLKTFKDLGTGKTLQLKEGRFGLYLTDGETNASLRKGDDPEELTDERASEMMQQRKDYMASPEGQAKAAQRGAKKAKKAYQPSKASKVPAGEKAKKQAKMKSDAEPLKAKKAPGKLAAKKVATKKAGKRK
jgi:DNA topoisomerase I